jgi:hypothetical protein
MTLHFSGWIAAPAIVTVIAGSIASRAEAAFVTLEPIPGNQITSGSQIENYFNGGQDSYRNAGNGDPAGPADDVIFPTGGSGGVGTYNTTYFDSLAAAKVTTTGTYGHAVPSGAADVFFQSVASTMNFAPGYGATSLSFEYSSYAASNATVTAWSGTGGTGSSVVLSLAQNDFSSGAGQNCTTSYHCVWTLDSANLASIGGTAESVTFGGSLIGEADFDSITMNVVPVPVPGGLTLLLSGLAGIGLWGRGRKGACG